MEEIFKSHTENSPCAAALFCWDTHWGHNCRAFDERIALGTLLLYTQHWMAIQKSAPYARIAKSFRLFRLFQCEVHDQNPLYRRLWVYCWDVKTTCNASGPSYSYPFLSWSLLISLVCSMSCFSSLLVDSEFSSSWISSLDVWLRTCANTTGPLSLYSFREQAAHHNAFQKMAHMKLEGKAIKHGQ